MVREYIRNQDERDLIKALTSLSAQLRKLTKLNPLKVTSDDEYNDIRALNFKVVLGK